MIILDNMKRYILPALLLLIFIAIMNSGEILKKPMNSTDDVQMYIDTLNNAILNEKWSEADTHMVGLKNAWKIIGARIQFSVERNEMVLIDTNISRLEGALSIHDKPNAVIELHELRGHWNELEE